MGNEEQEMGLPPYVKSITVTLVPEGAQNQTRGVVFYLLPEAKLPRRELKESILPGVAAIFPGYPLRYGIRSQGDDQYWLGLNDPAWGTLLEDYLTRLRVRKTRSKKMPGDEPYPELKKVILIGSNTPLAKESADRVKMADRIKGKVPPGVAETLRGYAPKVPFTRRRRRDGKS